MSDENKGKVANPFLFFIMACIVGPIELTKALWNRTYVDGRTALTVPVGILIALSSGIGLGYEIGWVHSEPPQGAVFNALSSAWLWHWFSPASVLAAAVFCYAWPILYLAAFKWAADLSSALWSHVDGPMARKHRETTEWFKDLVMVISWGTMICASLYLGYQVFHHVLYAVIFSDNVDWWVGVLTITLGAAVLIALISVCNGFFRFVFIVGGIALCYFDWGLVSQLSLLTKFAAAIWIEAVGLGVLSALAAGVICGVMLYLAKIRLIAGLTGLATVYFLAGHTHAFAVALTGSHPVLASALYCALLALELALYVGFLYPIAHIALARVIPELLNVLNWAKAAYRESNEPYVNFVGQLTAIAVALGTGYSIAHFGSPYLNHWLLYPASAVGTVIVYGLLGELLPFVGVVPVGLVLGGWAGYRGYLLYDAHLHWFGDVGAAGAAVVSAVVTFVVLYPALYLIVRNCGGKWFAENIERGALTKMHEHFIKNLQRLRTLLVYAKYHTYHDTTPFRIIVAQISNIAFAYTLVSGAFLVGRHLGFAVWVAGLIALLVAYLSYVLLGKLLLKYGNQMVSFAVSGRVAIFAGTLAFAGSSQSWLVAILVGLVTAALTWDQLFPWTYIVARSIASFVQAERWLLPVLSKPHTYLLERAEAIRKEFFELYAQVLAQIKPAIQRFRDSYDEVRQTMKERFSNGKKK